MQSKLNEELVNIQWDSTHQAKEKNEAYTTVVKTERKEIPWFTAPLVKQGYQPFFDYFDGILETKSGAPWYSRKGMDELMWVDGKRPEREDWEAPITTK